MKKKDSEPKLLVCHLYAVKCMYVQVFEHLNVISISERNGIDNIHIHGETMEHLIMIRT